MEEEEGEEDEGNVVVGGTRRREGVSGTEAEAKEEGEGEEL